MGGRLQTPAERQRGASDSHKGTPEGHQQEPVGPVTEGGPSRALEGLEGEGKGSARLIALEGDDQGSGCGVY
jgi:hypothetical protein